MNGACASCGAATVTVLDLGNHRLADFLPEGCALSPAYPLRLMLCIQCKLLQLNDLTPRRALYHDRYGFKSGVNEAIRADLASVVKYALETVPDPESWLDIACNDGTLLSNVPERIYRAGIDPLRQFRDEAIGHADRIVTDFFSSRYFSDGGPGKFDVITSVSMFYDLADPVKFARDVARVLAPGGGWVIQQNYALDMIRRRAVDNVCHEHVTYFTVSSLIPVLEKAGLEIIDVGYSDVNGGCFRVLACHRRVRSPLASVQEAVAREAEAKLDWAATWREWGESVRKDLTRTRQFIEHITREGKSCWLYGASTRGGTILQAAEVGPELLPFAVERNPAKWGTVMAATGIPVISEREMRDNPPEYLLVSPWFFKDIFLRREREFLRGGGRMIFPLPRFEVVTRA